MRSVFPALLILLAVTTARATVLMPTDLGDLSRGARAIARARVVSVEGRRAADGRGIETLVTLDVESWLKSDLGRTVQFRVPGGSANGRRTFVVGAPAFTAGERVIVFLGANGPSMPYVLGLSQGVYRVLAGAAGGAIVTPPALLPVATTTAVVRGDVNRRPMALADFEDQVRRLAAAGGR